MSGKNLYMVLVPSVGQVLYMGPRTSENHHNEGNFQIYNMSTQLGRKEVLITLR